MEKELIDKVRARLHALIDAAIDEYSVKLSKSTEQQIPTPDGLDIDKLPWQKSKHGEYEYLFPSQVPDKLRTTLKDGKAQIKDCILYMTKQGSVRRYHIVRNKRDWPKPRDTVCPYDREYRGYYSGISSIVSL